MPELIFKGWMAAHNISQRELAEFLGVSYTTINKKVNGKEDFSMAQARAIRAHYGCSAEVFLPLQRTELCD